MNNNALTAVRPWLSTAGRLVLRQWPSWLVAQALQGLLIAIILVLAILIIAIPTIGLGIRSLDGLDIGALRGLLHLVPVTVLIVGFLVQIISAWATTVMTCGIACGAEQQGSVGDLLVRGAKRTWRAFLASVILTCIGIGALFCLVLPFFILIPGLIMTWYLVVLEGRGVREALAESWAMTRGVRYEILCRLAILVGAGIVIFLLLNALLAIPIIGLISMPLNLAFQLVLPAFFVAAGFVIHKDLYSSDVLVGEPEAPMALFYLVAAWGVVAVGFLLFIIFEKVPGLILSALS
jgi:hypothetical protein